MEVREGPPLCSHLADFETTTSDLLRPGQAVALLNFAALFHEVIYLPDIALGDHELIIKSFHERAHSGFFRHLKALIEQGILRVLMRDKVVVGEEIRVPSNPTIRQIFEGWLYRDKTKWKGEQGYTTQIDKKIRLAYCREIDDLIASPGTIQRYNPDLVKAGFRRIIREQLENGSTRLSRSVAELPRELQRKYRETLNDPWFTNAELWRVLRKAKNAGESIILHGHVNQQCFANLVDAGQSAQDITPESLASFNLELQLRRPLAPEADATLYPPKNLDDLMERAPVLLPSPSIEMFECLSVEKVIALRRKAKKVFEIARRQIDPAQMEDVRNDYLHALEGYWQYILETFEEMDPEKMKRPTRLGLFIEQQLPSLDWLYKKFGRSLFALLLRVKFGPAGATIGEAVNHIGIYVLQERTPLNESLRGAIPPGRWYRRGILGLDRYS
ncbi:MAG: hypothetical protein LAO78_11475 [Acidobacteriia bacterium]|nr:hypothetical protein [Terriglobia bacterium]